METKKSKARAIKTVATKKSAEKYIKSIEDVKRKKDCIIIKDLMQKISKQKPVMWGESIVGFGKMKMKYSTGKEVEWMKMGFSSRKQAISIYLTCNLNQLEEKLDKLGPYKRGVGCLYIKSLQNIDMKVLESLFKASMLLKY